MEHGILRQLARYERAQGSTNALIKIRKKREHDIGTAISNRQWHTSVSDLRADLADAWPGVTILDVNGFLIRNAGSSVTNVK